MMQRTGRFDLQDCIILSSFNKENHDSEKKEVYLIVWSMGTKTTDSN